MRQPEETGIANILASLRSLLGVHLQECGLRIKLLVGELSAVSSAAVRTLDEDFRIKAIAFSGGREWAFFS